MVVLRQAMGGTCGAVAGGGGVAARGGGGGVGGEMSERMENCECVEMCGW